MNQPKAMQNQPTTAVVLNCPHHLTDSNSMKIPYGESNFKKVITGGYVYIDKTAYIAQLETAGSYPIYFIHSEREMDKKYPRRTATGA